LPLGLGADGLGSGNAVPSPEELRAVVSDMTGPHSLPKCPVSRDTAYHSELQTKQKA